MVDTLKRVPNLLWEFCMKKVYMACMILAFFAHGFTAYAKDEDEEDIEIEIEIEIEIPAEGFNQGTVFRGFSGGEVDLSDGVYTSYTSKGIPVELIVPSATGKSFVRIPIENDFDPSAAYLDAQELRLKVRELTSQLLETWEFSGVKGMVAYVTTFTPQHDLKRPTPFGQYLRDAFIYEFNNRGFPVRDFSARDLIVSQGGFSYGVSNNTYITPALSKNTAIITGTFYRDEDYLFMNVRLVRGYDGMVLRTAQTIFPVTPLVGRMADRDYRPDPPPRPPLSVGGLPIVAGKRIR